METRYVAFSMLWYADNPGSDRRASVARDSCTDMRRGFPSLALQVQEVLLKDPLGGHLFVFRGRRSDLVKVIWQDGQGACLFAKDSREGGSSGHRLRAASIVRIVQR